MSRTCAGRVAGLEVAAPRVQRGLSGGVGGGVVRVGPTLALGQFPAISTIRVAAVRRVLNRLPQKVIVSLVWERWALGT